VVHDSAKVPAAALGGAARAFETPRDDV
jgi:hypothetical protein